MRDDLVEAALVRRVLRKATPNGGRQLPEVIVPFGPEPHDIWTPLQAREHRLEPAEPARSLRNGRLHDVIDLVEWHEGEEDGHMGRHTECR